MSHRMTEAEYRTKQLDRIEVIIKVVDHGSRDVALISELTSLAYHFSGMEKRRRLLDARLKKLGELKQQHAIDECWAEIHSLVSDFTWEAAQYRSHPAQQ